MNIDYPYTIDASGRTAQTDDADHIRDLIEQVLFTSPGERVNRPTFGSGILGLVFEPNSGALTAAAQASAVASLQQWLGSLIQVTGIDVESEDATLTLTISYTIRRTQEARVDQFTRSV